jgi:Ca2+-transporting ATPase
MTTSTASPARQQAATGADGSPLELWYTLPAAEVMQRLGSTAASGLTAAEAARRLAVTGFNELVERGGRSRWEILVEQFTNILTILLIVAAVVSAFLGDWVEAVVILLIVILNGVLGFTQEYRAEQSMAALKRMAVPTVRVRRDGHVQEISAREVVPGDVVILETGNVIPADGRVISDSNLKAMEAALTGESEAVEKETVLLFQEGSALGDRRNMLYSGTIVTYGRGEMVITATGMATELGKIANLLQSVADEQTPLQQRLNRLGKVLAIAAIALVIVIFTAGVLGGNSIETMLLTAVSLAVAAVPEALTAVVTIALSLGAQRMLKRRALIRRLPAVETLGSVTIICSDKTGTLTQNRMSVTALDIANHTIVLEQRSEDGRMSLERAEGSPLPEHILPTLDLLLVSGALCSDAVLERDEQGDPSGTHRFHAVGDPTEGALVLAAAEYGILKGELDATYPRIAELPFDSVRKRMTTVHRLPQEDDRIPTNLVDIWERRHHKDANVAYLAVTKGALDGILRHSSTVWVEGDLAPLDEEWRRRIVEHHNALAAMGMRVLAVAIRPLDHAPTKEEVEGIEDDLIVLGLFGMIDPPRVEVRDAVMTCRTAGIRPVMITGDHPLTARHIAQQVGITDDAETAGFVIGQELDKLDENELRTKAREVQVFARVSPEHKLRLVQAYQDEGNIVAMTGDGVNDAPALKKADIGVAMGITGTDVSKEAAEMVLLDDNFATIVAAVEEGRTVYDNIRKFIKYLLSCNASEIAVMLLWPIVAWVMGLTLGAEAGIALLPLQILWMNLVTDGLPALALGVEQAELRVMRRPPYRPDEGIFARGMGTYIIFIGVVMSLAAIAIGMIAYVEGDPAWQTLLFTTLIFAQSAVAVSVRSEVESIFKIGFFSNRSMVLAIVSTVVLQLLVVYVPFLQRIFNTDALGVRDLLIALAAALAVFAISEAWKALFGHRPNTGYAESAKGAAKV